jgi:putative endonuclease
VEYYVYVLQSYSTGKFYTGITSDIERRLTEHNGTNSGTLSTKNLHDYKPIFVEIVDNMVGARKLEKYLKSGTGREFRTEIVKYNVHGDRSSMVERFPVEEEVGGPIPLDHP